MMQVSWGVSPVKQLPGVGLPPAIPADIIFANMGSPPFSFAFRFTLTPEILYSYSERAHPDCTVMLLDYKNIVIETKGIYE